ncbi:MAG: hypothetical protein K0R05_3282 [Anaerocolumna sp.]|nr:hypothetical protein [Anaerocolumna sp.]
MSDTVKVIGDRIRLIRTNTNANGENDTDISLLINRLNSLNPSEQREIFFYINQVNAFMRCK